VLEVCLKNKLKNAYVYNNYLNDFCFAYINDVLVFFKNKKKY
jgi:hypothetical protein